MTTTQDAMPASVLTGTVFTTGTGQLLNAAYCSQRSAAALVKAEEATVHPETSAMWVTVARRWEKLGLALASHPTMLPQPPNPDNARR